MSTTKSARARFSASDSCRLSSASSFAGVMPGRAEHARPLHLFRRAHHHGDIDAGSGIGLEQERDLEHGELGALPLLLAQEIELGLHHHRMHDGFELFQLLGRAGHLLREQRPVDLALAHGRWKRGFDRRHRLALIEPVHLGVGVAHRHAALAEVLGRGGLAHADRAGETDDQHHDASRCATTWARSSGVTSGLTPNQRSKPGTAWCSSMPRPSTMRLPRALAAASSVVSSGL